MRYERNWIISMGISFSAIVVLCVAAIVLLLLLNFQSIVISIIVLIGLIGLVYLGIKIYSQKFVKYLEITKGQIITKYRTGESNSINIKDIEKIQFIEAYAGDVVSDRLEIQTKNKKEIITLPYTFNKAKEMMEELEKVSGVKIIKIKTLAP